MDLNVEFCPEAEATVVLRATRAADKVLSNDLELEVGGVLAVEKSSSARDCDAKENLEAQKFQKPYIWKPKTSTTKIKKKKIKEKQESLDADNGGVKTALPFQEGEEKHKFSGLILLSEAAETQELKPELKPPSNAKESEAAVAAKG
ncbi:hypothetical protein GH714_001187 [Hevea brasiliensis]|uniref:Uncharacterized protein n=1 Tax=Hevea brasiliensis TaxID=3981 RepID=A0A6A6K3K1_HEVBR|nr:hypothetical protein GH714_001187 [Hevea brasiliensis]